MQCMVSDSASHTLCKPMQLESTPSSSGVDIVPSDPLFEVPTCPAVAGAEICETFRADVETMVGSHQRLNQGFRTVPGWPQWVTSHQTVTTNPSAV